MRHFVARNVKKLSVLLKVLFDLKILLVAIRTTSEPQHICFVEHTFWNSPHIGRCRQDILYGRW